MVNSGDRSDAGAASRRDVLRMTGTAIAAALAGCEGLGSPFTPTNTAEQTTLQPSTTWTTQRTTRDPANIDEDGDGLTLAEERKYGTSPRDGDTTGDGIDDPIARDLDLPPDRAYSDSFARLVNGVYRDDPARARAVADIWLDDQGRVSENGRELLQYLDRFSDDTWDHIIQQVTQEETQEGTLPDVVVANVSVLPHISADPDTAEPAAVLEDYSLYDPDWDGDTVPNRIEGRPGFPSDPLGAETRLAEVGQYFEWGDVSDTSVEFLRYVADRPDVWPQVQATEVYRDGAVTADELQQVQPAEGDKVIRMFDPAPDTVDWSRDGIPTWAKLFGWQRDGYEAVPLHEMTEPGRTDIIIRHFSPAGDDYSEEVKQRVQDYCANWEHLQNPDGSTGANIIFSQMDVDRDLPDDPSDEQVVDIMRDDRFYGTAVYAAVFEPGGRHAGSEARVHNSYFFVETESEYEDLFGDIGQSAMVQSDNTVHELVHTILGALPEEVQQAEDINHNRKDGYLMSSSTTVDEDSEMAPQTRLSNRP